MGQKHESLVKYVVVQVAVITVKDWGHAVPMLVVILDMLNTNVSNVMEQVFVLNAVAMDTLMIKK